MTSCDETQTFVFYHVWLGLPIANCDMRLMAIVASLSDAHHKVLSKPSAWLLQAELLLVSSRAVCLLQAGLLPVSGRASAYFCQDCCLLAAANVEVPCQFVDALD